MNTLRRALPLCVALAAGCASADDAAPETWEQRLQRSTGHAGDQAIYTVDGDLQVSLDELRADHDRRLAVGDDEVGLRSTVNIIGGGRDDAWTPSQARNLTYCISDEFGADKPRAVAEVAQATAAWSTAGGVTFVYHPEHDASCATANTAVLFSVRPFTSPTASVGMIGFLPSGFRTLWIDFATIDHDTIRAADFPLVTSVGLLRHEVGHILGLRHENVRAPGDAPASCQENTSWTALNEYDASSAMQALYVRATWMPCAASIDTALEVTASDLAGINELYGPRPATAGGTRIFLGCDGGTRFELHWKTRRGAPAFHYDVDVQIAGSTSWQHLYSGWEQKTLYRGASGRRDTARVRACNSAGCGPYGYIHVQAKCSDPPDTSARHDDDDDRRPTARSI